MKEMIIKMNGKKISLSKAEDIIGKERMNQRIQDAIEYAHEEPGEPCGWMDGMEMLIVEF